MKALGRKLQILRAVVEQYVQTGAPIGSKTLLEELELSLSSATIRADMAELSKGGYLEQLHISSGRIPSDLGYRLYINKAMRAQELTEEEKNFISGQLLTSSPSSEKLLTKAATLLSEITDCIVILTSPPTDGARIKKITLVKIFEKTAMMILATTNGAVKTKIFRCEYEITDDILKILSKILTEKFVGERLEFASPEYVDIVVGSGNPLTPLIDPILDVFFEVVEEVSKVKVITKGHQKLLQFSELDFETILSILEILEKKHRVLSLFSEDENEIKFFVGEENKIPEFKNVSVAISSYKVGNKRGNIGLIGSTRINYSFISSRTKYVANVVGDMLEQLVVNN